MSKKATEKIRYGMPVISQVENINQCWNGFLQHFVFLKFTLSL